MPLRSSDQEDHLRRLMREASDAIRRLREQLSGGAGPPEMIGREAATSITALLGDEAPLLGMLDATTAVRLIGNAERVSLWAALVEVEAEAAVAAGDAGAAAGRRARAAELRAAISIAGTTGGV